VPRRKLRELTKTVNELTLDRLKTNAKILLSNLGAFFTAMIFLRLVPESAQVLFD
jgi:hypothetical protein